MNTGQAMLTLAALIMAALIVLNFQLTVGAARSDLDYNRFRLEASSVLTSRIEQLSQYYFDEASTDTSSAKDLAHFTQPNQLGMEINDEGVMDDIDDFNALTLPDTGLSGVVYQTRFDVDYTTWNNVNFLLQHSAERSWHKRLTISVTDAQNPPLLYRSENGVTVRDTLRATVVVSYWFYN